jgi:hypothetical protein
MLTRVQSEVTVTGVHVEPLSCVISITPVPVRRFIRQPVMRASDALVIDCRTVPFPAVAVNVVALFATPSGPVAVFAAVTLLFVHDAFVPSLLCKARFVAAVHSARIP